jgi:hypothetical protein
MWFGKNDNKWEDECPPQKVVFKKMTVEDLKKQLDIMQLQVQLEELFNISLGNKNE